MGGETNAWTVDRYAAALAAAMNGNIDTTVAGFIFAI